MKAITYREYGGPGVLQLEEGAKNRSGHSRRLRAPTIRRFSAIEYRRRFGCAGGSVAAGSMVARAEALILCGPTLRMNCYALLTPHRGPIPLSVEPEIGAMPAFNS